MLTPPFTGFPSELSGAFVCTREGMAVGKCCAWSYRNRHLFVSSLRNKLWGAWWLHWSLPGLWWWTVSSNKLLTLLLVALGRSLRCLRASGHCLWWRNIDVCPDGANPVQMCSCMSEMDSVILTLKKEIKQAFPLAGIPVLTDTCNGIDMFVILWVQGRKITFPCFSTVVLLQRELFGCCHLSVLGRTPWSAPTDHEGNFWPMFLWFQTTPACGARRAVLVTSSEQHQVVSLQVQQSSRNPAQSLLVWG